MKSGGFPFKPTKPRLIFSWGMLDSELPYARLSKVSEIHQLRIRRTVILRYLLPRGGR
jgi:hypothetical protein